jgi:predicted kinase
LVETCWFVLLKGLAGTGKSTLARALSRTRGWPLIDKDDVKDLLDGEAKAAGPLSYAIMLNVARRQMEQGLSVICDSPLTYRSLYEEAEQIAASTGSRLAVIECVCSNEQRWQDRIDKRAALSLPAHHQTNWYAFQEHRLRAAAESRYPISAPYLVVDTVQPLAITLVTVTAWLAQLGGDRELVPEDSTSLTHRPTR